MDPIRDAVAEEQKAELFSDVSPPAEPSKFAILGPALVTQPLDDMWLVSILTENISYLFLKLFSSGPIASSITITQQLYLNVKPSPSVTSAPLSNGETKSSDTSASLLLFSEWQQYQ
jgi:hypothetical protein